MLEKKIKKECPFSDEIVSYIYGEIDGREQRDFETHLSDCVKCTDEFAAISESRFAVYDWQKTEFAPLLTPEIEIPYKRAAAVNGKKAGIFSQLSELLGIGFRPAFAAAILLLIVGTVFVSLRSNLSDHTASDAVLTAENKTAPPANDVDSVRLPGLVKRESDDRRETGRTISVMAKSKPEVQPVKAKFLQKETVRLPRQMTAETLRPEELEPKKAARKAPVLNGFDEDEDDTLRLADLFEDGGA